MDILQNMTWKEVKNRMNSNAIALLPIGSTEQHGLHAPLGVDSIVAEFLARKAAEEKDVICTPTVSVGVSDYHRQFWGTLWVSPETLKAYVREIVSSLHFHKIRRVILVNGHGGNRGCLRELARELRRNKAIYVVLWTWFEAIQDEIIKLFGKPRPPLHADCVETSILGAISEKYVRKELLRKSLQNGSPDWGEYHNKILVSEEVVDFSESGATGDPTKTDFEKGKILIQKAESNLISIIDWLQKKPVTDLGPKRHK